jgi:hypothetical protein
MVAVKTDLVKDVAMIPNLGVELVVGERHTMGLQVFGATESWGKSTKIIGLSPSFRYWLSGRAMSRLFVGVNAAAVNYDITWNSDIYCGNSASLGLSFGYAFNLSERFNMEVQAGTELMAYSNKEYRLGDSFANYGKAANAHGTILFPRLEVSIVYVIR